MEHANILSIGSDKRQQENCAVIKTILNTSLFKVQSYTNISDTIQ